MKLKNKKRIFLIVACMLVIGGEINFINFNRTSKIERILKTESYAYLPKAAQNYIKEVYEETGEVILTEKNKEENVPYLNPKYVSYLQLSSEQKKIVSLIPNPYSVDYVFASSGSSSQGFPRSYNLENVDGKNYTSPMYNQGNLGTCWAFATIENAESHLMIKKNEPQNENSTRFSVRQLDYAASTNGIKGYENPWGVAALGLGGNFIYATTLMANGLSLVDDSYMPYVETLDEKPLHEIHNYSNSLYEVNSTVNLPNIGKIDLEFTKECDNVDDWEACYDAKQEELIQAYINIIKEGITNYGGIYVGAYDPTGQCGALNTDGYYVLDPNSTCLPMGSTAFAETGHAMQIIGWNDDYEYSYCRKSTHSSTVNGTCTSGTLTEGTGAWLVKNSWGESDAEYIYLTYDAIQNNLVDFAYITSLSEMKDKNWDNVYNNGKISSSIIKKLTQTFEKKHNNQEKIQKIKFHTLLMNQQYSISVQVDGNTYLITDSYQTEYPGLYTVDVSDKNIFLGSGNFDIIISCSNSSINSNSISVFTKNVDSEQLIITEEEKDIDSNKFMIYSETRNISSNSEIIYELYDDTEKLENVMQVNNNIVAANNINAEISLIKKLEPGTYRLVQKIGDVEASTSLNIGTILDGAGTVDNPYKIYNEEDLKYVHNHLDSHYELESDIELTEEWIPIGTTENPFTGAFNGKNHKITNLQINDSTLEYAGLFGYVKDSDDHQTYIKNIYLENPNIIAQKYVGGLIGGININQTGTKTALIDSIYIIGGSIEGEYANGLVADISGYKKLTINNIFSSATIKGKSYSSLIRFSSNQYNSNNGTSISNIQNIGVMLDNNVSYYKTSLISANYSYYYNISNYISTGYSKKNTTINQFYDTPIHNIDYNYSNNGYALSRSDSTYEFPNIIKKVSDITELKNTDKYSEWGEDFNTYWEIAEVDGIKRIPILKGVDLDYTDSINDINIEFGNDISLSDYLSSKIITRRLKVTTDNDDIIKISEKYNNSEAYPYEIIISPLKSGTATMHVISDYDGFENDVTITVYKTELKITYHNDSDTSVQTITNGSTVNLTKNTFEKEWYTFIGWNTKADGTGTSYVDEQEVTITDDLDLYAQWERNTVKISFDANGGILDGTDAMEDIIVPVSDYMTVSVPYSKFIKKGYKMSSWNTKPDGSGERYLTGGVITPTDDIILYAQWEPNSYSVAYYYLFKDVQTLINKEMLTYDVESELKEAYLAEDGYKFAYWGTKADGTGMNYLANQKVKNLTEDTETINLYTIYEPITYNIVFNSNNENNDITEQSLIYDNEASLNNNSFIKEGYKFKEWNTKADGTGISYENEQTVKNLTTKDGSTINLYAIWEKQKFSVTFDSNEGVFAENKTTIVVDGWEDSKLESIEKPTRQGYTFKGYYTKKTGGTSIESYIAEFEIDQDGLIFYAQWEEAYSYIINKYSVDETSKYIDLIDINTSVDEFKKNIEVNNGYTVEVDYKSVNGKNLLYTGGKTKVYKNNELYAEYTNIIRGDVNGNAIIDIIDYIRIMKDIMDTTKLTDVYIKAADVNQNGKIDIIDYIRIMKMIMEEN